MDDTFPSLYLIMHLAINLIHVGKRGRRWLKNMTAFSHSRYIYHIFCGRQKSVYDTVITIANDGLMTAAAWYWPSSRVIFFDLNYYTKTNWFGGRLLTIKSSSPWQNRCHFADDISMCISWIIIKVGFFVLIHNSLRFIPKGPFDNKSALAEIMADDKPSLETIVTIL